MRFITIQTKFGETVAINTDNITSIMMESVGHASWAMIYMSGDNPIPTQFTSIEHAIDYIQRAPSVSLSNAA